MYLQCFVEELSAEAALQALLPRILPEETEFTITVFQGKTDLLKNLAARLAGLATWIPADWRIIVLVDRDDDDCSALKQRLNQMAAEVGLRLRGAGQEGQQLQILNRIAIEELEAWFFGDIPALRVVYPKLSEHLARRDRYRDSDAITGGTWEALERELQRVGYHKGGLPKITLARDVAPHLEPIRNRSDSFQAFYQGVRELVGLP